MKQSRDSLTRNALILTGTSVASQMGGVIYRIFLSRTIGAENMGLFQLLMPVYSAAMAVLSVGLTASVSRLTAEYHALNNGRAAYQVLRQCRNIFILLFAVFAAATVLLNDPISVVLLGDARTQTGLLILLPCIFFTGIENLYKYHFYGTGRIRPPAITEFAEQIIRTAAVLTLLAVFYPCSGETTVGLIVAGMAICEVFSAFTLAVLYRRYRDRPSPKDRPLPGELLKRKIGAIAFPVGATSVLGSLMTSANAVLIPRRLILSGIPVEQAMESFGILFGMTIPMMLLPGAFIGALSLTLMPKLAESRALGRKEEIRQRTSKAISATVLLVLPALVFLLFFGKPLGSVLFHEASAGEALPALSPGILFVFLQGITGCCLNGIGIHRPTALISIFSDVIQLGFTWYFTAIPGVGMRGFIAGLAVSSALGFLLNLICLMKETGLRIEVRNWILAPGAAAAGMFFSLRFLLEVLPAPGMELFRGLAATVGGGAAYLLILVLLGVPIRVGSARHRRG